MIRENVLPHILFGNRKPLSNIVGVQSKMLVRKSGLGILNPLTPANKKYLILQRASAELILSVTGGGGGHSPTPTTTFRSWKKGATDRNTVTKPMNPN